MIYFPEGSIVQNAKNFFCIFPKFVCMFIFVHFFERLSSKTLISAAGYPVILRTYAEYKMTQLALKCKNFSPESMQCAYLFRFASHCSVQIFSFYIWVEFRYKILAIFLLLGKDLSAICLQTYKCPMNIGLSWLNRRQAAGETITFPKRQIWCVCKRTIPVASKHH